MKVAEERWCSAHAIAVRGPCPFCKADQVLRESEESLGDALALLFAVVGFVVGLAIGVLLIAAGRV